MDYSAGFLFANLAHLAEQHPRNVQVLKFESESWLFLIVSRFFHIFCINLQLHSNIVIGLFHIIFQSPIITEHFLQMIPDTNDVSRFFGYPIAF